MPRPSPSPADTEGNTGTISVALTTKERNLLCAALDSHIYWELSDKAYRRSGYVEAPGADDESTVAEIAEAELLLRRLDAQRETLSGDREETPRT